MVLIASLVLFWTARHGYWEIVVAMALDGFGVGCVYAVNPLQITGGVPADETGSAMSFYQLVRTIAHSLASALSATVLIEAIPRGQRFPTDHGYRTAAALNTAILAVALAVSALFAARTRNPATHDRPALPQAT
ncbi:MAG: hypothetical protein M0004_15630 [Actinomycetota bacterium]|nr:hypothetical protein [Actinomycetota bacterium]